MKFNICAQKKEQKYRTNCTFDLPYSSINNTQNIRPLKLMIKLKLGKQSYWSDKKTFHVS